MSSKTEGQRIAEAIFRLGDVGVLRTDRIEFKVKTKSGEEVGTGGLCQEVLADFIDRQLLPRRTPGRCWSFKMKAGAALGAIS